MGKHVRTQGQLNTCFILLLRVLQSLNASKHKPQKSILFLLQLCFSVAEEFSSVLHGEAGSGGMSSVVWDELCEESGMKPCQSGRNWDHQHVKQPHAKNLNLWTQFYWESLFFITPGCRLWSPRTDKMLQKVVRQVKNISEYINKWCYNVI